MTPLPAALQLHSSPSIRLITHEASGSYGNVFKTTVESEDGNITTVAVKQATLGKWGAPALSNEVQTLTTLGNNVPHLVKMINGSISTDPTEPSILVMPFLQGANLFKAYPQKPGKPAFSFSETVSIIRQTLECLTHFHAKGLVHGDVSLENMAYNRSSCNVTLYDLGGVRCVSPTPMPGEHFVTRRMYEAPEISLHGTCGRGVDIWAVGCILFELLTGEILFYSLGDPYTNGAIADHLRVLCERKQSFPPPTCLANWRGSETFFKLSVDKQTVTGYVHDSLSTKDRGISYEPWEITISKIAHQFSWPEERLRQTILFLQSLLEFDPAKRSTAEDALKSPFFKTDIAFKFSTKIPPGFTTKVNQFAFFPPLCDMPDAAPLSTPETPILTLAYPSSPHCAHIPKASAPYRVNAIDSQGNTLATLNAVKIAEGDTVTFTIAQQLLMS